MVKITDLPKHERPQKSPLACPERSRGERGGFRPEGGRRGVLSRERRFTV